MLVATLELELPSTFVSFFSHLQQGLVLLEDVVGKGIEWAARAMASHSVLDLLKNLKLPWMELVKADPEEVFWCGEDLKLKWEILQDVILSAWSKMGQLSEIRHALIPLVV